MRFLLEYVLSVLFPPKLGKIEGVDSVVLLHAIEQGQIEVNRGTLTLEDKSEVKDDSGSGRLYVWPYGFENGTRHRVR